MPNGRQQAYGNKLKSWAKIDDTLGEQDFNPILAYSVLSLDILDMTYRKPLDLNMTDFRHLVDEARVRYDTGHRKHRETVIKGVKGVRTNCLGDQMVFGYPEYEAANVPASIIEEAHTRGITAPIAKPLGLPLAMGKVAEALSWRGRPFDGKPACTNRVFPCKWLSGFESSCAHQLTRVLALGLTMFYDDEKDPPPNTQAFRDQIANHGSVFVARLDGKILHPEHVQALVAYLRKVLSENLKDKRLDMDEYLALLSKDHFIKFWDTWIEKHPEAKNIPSPYEV